MKLNISSLMKDDKLLEKYNEIWGKKKQHEKKNFVVNLYTIKKK